MKTPDEILNDLWLLNGRPVVRDIPPDNWREIALMAMKEFGRQAWIKCASTYESVSRMEAKESRMYEHYLKEAYLNQIAQESQERGEYQNPVKDLEDDFKNEFGEFLKDDPKPKKCEHKNSYFFHENAPRYCPDCGKYIDGGNEI